MSSPVEKIKEHLTITDVVSSYLKLEKAGAYFKARCPFHNEKSASFFVSPARGSYHCFGCGKGGDIFSFVEEIEGIAFKEALRLLADRAGVTLTREDTEGKSEESLLFKVLEDATRFYEAELPRHKDALAYLKKRGLTDETIKEFRVGYAPDGWTPLVSYLSGKGVRDASIEKAGLGIPGNNGLYDRFRGRIMFPIANSQGKVVGFSGRVYPEPKAGEKEMAKYVNSPETMLYNKSAILFGYDKAKTAFLKEGACILVEGQMDLLMAHQSGTKNVVAVSGTALTDMHLSLIKRFTDKLLLAFDADSAGLRASERGVRGALTFGMDVKIIKLPKGIDPAEAILKDPAIWKDAVAHGMHIVDFYLEHLREMGYDERTFKMEVSKRVLPYVAAISNSIDQAHFVHVIAGAIGTPEDVVAAELKKIPSFTEEDRGGPPVNIPHKEASHSIENTLVGILLWQKTLTTPTVDIADLEKKYEAIIGVGVEQKISMLSEKEKEGLILKTEMYYRDRPTLSLDSKGLLNGLEREILGNQFSMLLAELRIAEASGKTERAREILETCQKLSARINSLKQESR